jgi:hypothetical protein
MALDPPAAVESLAAPPLAQVAAVEADQGARTDSQEDVGGYPNLPETNRRLDVPDRGFAEWLNRFTRDVELTDA